MGEKKGGGVLLSPSPQPSPSRERARKLL